MTNSLEAFVKVVAYGVPALLILLGFFATVSGKVAEALLGSSQDITGIGIWMILSGTIIYLVELGLAYSAKQNDGW